MSTVSQEILGKKGGDFGFEDGFGISEEVELTSAGERDDTTLPEGDVDFGEGDELKLSPEKIEGDEWNDDANLI